MTAEDTTTSAPIGWRRMIPAIVSTALGFALTLTCYNHLLRGRFHTPMERLGALAGVLLCVTVLSYLALAQFVQPRLLAYTRRVQIAWLGWSLILAAVFLWCLPVMVPIKSQLHRLEVTATGKKAFLSAGTSVWLNDLTLHGAKIPVRDLQQADTWEQQFDTLVSTQNQPATFVWEHVTDGDVQLRLRGLPWGGFATVRWDTQEWTVDLYANPPADRVLTLPGAMAPLDHAPMGAYQYLSVGADVLALAALLLVISIAVLAPRHWYTRLCRHWGLAWWVVPLLMIVSLPLTNVLTPIFLVGGIPQHLVTTQDRLWVWCYTAMALGTLCYLVPRRGQITQATSVRFKHSLRWLDRDILGQSGAAWMLVALVALVGAAILTRQLNVSGQRAIWFKVGIDTVGDTPPTAFLRYDDSATQQIMWQPSAQTNLAVLPTGNVPQAIQVQAIATEAGPMPLEQVSGPPGMVITNTATARLAWPQPSHAITLTLSGNGPAEVRWFDQRVPVELGTQPTNVVLKLPGQFQGWVLIPPQETHQLSLLLPASSAPYRLRLLSVLGDVPQTWSPQTGFGAWNAQGCRIEPDATALVVVTTSALCTLQVPNVVPVNTTHLGTTLFVGVLLALVIGAVLALGCIIAGWVTKRLQPRDRRPLFAASPVKQPHLILALVGVAAVALVWHGLFALIVPLSDTPDSFAYYGPALQLLTSFKLSEVYTGRTPGYPILIAGWLKIFGTTMRAAIIGNHLMMAMLGPLTVWALARRIGLVGATLAGLCVALSPANSIYANLVMSESPFAVWSTAALLVYLKYEDKPRGVLVSGMLVGVATMVRPNGLILLAVLIGWLLLCGWLTISNKASQRLVLHGVTALLVGYLFVAAPWHLQQWLARGTTDISEGRAIFTKWAALSYQKLIDADLEVNRPERAFWTVLWQTDPYALIQTAPQTVGGYVGDGTTYYNATYREVAKTDTRKWLDSIRVSLIYNLTFLWKTENINYYYWAQISGVASYFHDTADVPLTPEEREQMPLLSRIYDKSTPFVSLRVPMVDLGWFMLQHWVWLAIPALFCPLLLLFLPQIRSLITIWLFWVGNILSLSLISMPVERYIAVLEPLLYVMLIATFTTLVQISYRSIIARMKRSANNPLQQIPPLLKSKKLLFASGCGLIATLSYFNHFVRPLVTSNREQLFLVLYLAVFFTALAYLLLHYTLPTLGMYSRRAVATGALAALAVGAALVLALPIRIPAPPTHHTLTVTATGQRNAAAKDSQIWVTGLYRGDGSLVAPQEFALNGAWEAHSEAPTVSLGQQPASFAWEGTLYQDAQLEFIAHPWSGVVQISWDGQPQTVDLFADVSTLDHKRVVLAVPPPQLWLVRWLAHAVDAAVLGMLTFVLGVWLLNRLRRWRSARAATERGSVGAGAMPAASLVRWLIFAGAMVLVQLVAARGQGLTQPNFHQLEITATGQRASTAAASQVWVLGIYGADGKQVPVSELALDGAWRVSQNPPNNPAIYTEQPGTLRWRGLTQSTMRVDLLTHDWSGVAQVRWDDTVQTIDLYSPAHAQRTLTFTASSSAYWQRVARFGAQIVSLTSLVLLVSFWFMRRLIPATRAAAEQQPRWLRFLRHQRRLNWALIPLIALPSAALTPTLVRVFFAEGWYNYQPVARDYVLVWVYAAFTLTTLWYLCVYRPAPAAPGQPMAGQRLRWWQRVVSGQTLGSWLFAGVAMAVVAWFLAGQLSSTQYAAWVKLALDSPQGAPVQAQLRYGAEPDAVVPFEIWQPYSTTDITVRPVGTLAQPLHIQAVTTDRGPLPLDQITLTQGVRDASGIVLSDPRGGLLTLPQASRAFTLTLAPGSGMVDVLRLDQKTTVQLGAQPVAAALELPAAYQGWALLPPQPVEHLAIEFPADTLTTARIRQVEIERDAPQVVSWKTADAWSAQGCSVRLDSQSVLATTDGQTLCTVNVPGVQPFNMPDDGRRTLIWLGLTGVLLVMLRLLLLFPHLERRIATSYQLTETSFGRWVSACSQHWNIGRTLLLVWLFALLVQLTYLLATIILTIGDSVDYFGVGEILAHTLRFAAMNSVRTPGYPLFIAATIASAPHSNALLNVVVAQHMLLSLLAPLAVWTLARRLPLIVACVAGILIACAPLTSINANTISTEALFTCLTVATLLVFSVYETRVRGALVAGLLSGAVVMVRPNGAVLVAILLAWLALQWWLQAGERSRQRAALASCGALLAGYLVVAVPWHIHLKIVRGTYDLSQNLAALSGWVAGATQKRIDAEMPLNRPERALWSASYAWGDDPFLLLGRAPNMLHGLEARMQPYYTATNREELRLYPERWRNNFQAALIYNTLLVKADQRYQYWEEMTAAISLTRTGVPRPSLWPDDPVSNQMALLTQQWQPPFAAWRVFLVQAPMLVLAHWVWLAFPALFSVVVLLLVPHMRVFVPAWLFWMALVISTSALGMPVERYMVVVEPLLYIFVIVGLYGLLCLRYVRVGVPTQGQVRKRGIVEALELSPKRGDIAILPES